MPFYIHPMPSLKKSSPWKLVPPPFPPILYFCCFPVTSELILYTIISSFASIDSRAGRFPIAALFWRCLFANCLHSAMLQANTWSALFLVSACSMMVVAALGHGEIHFRLHFEFHLQLTLYFTLNCIFIFVQLKNKVVLFLKFTVLLIFISFYF